MQRLLTTDLYDLQHNDARAGLWLPCLAPGFASGATDSETVALSTELRGLWWFAHPSEGQDTDHSREAADIGFQTSVLDCAGDHFGTE